MKLQKDIAYRPKSNYIFSGKEIVEYVSKINLIQRDETHYTWRFSHFSKNHGKRSTYLWDT